MSYDEAVESGEARARAARALGIVELEAQIVHYESDGDPADEPRLAATRHALARLLEAEDRELGLA